MDRHTLDRLKEHLLKRLVEGEIDKTLYDQILAELEAFPSDASAESFAWEQKLSEWARRAGRVYGTIGEKFADVFSSDSPKSGESKNKPEFSYSGSKEKEDPQREAGKTNLQRRLRLLSLFVLIHAVNTLLFGVLHVFEVWNRSNTPFGVLSVVAGIAMLATGYCMREMRHYSYVWWSLFLFLTPVFGLWPLGLLIGIVGLVLLSDRPAEESFDSEAELKGSYYSGTPSGKKTYRETAEERRERKRLQKYS